MIRGREGMATSQGEAKGGILNPISKLVSYLPTYYLIRQMRPR